MPTLTSPWLLPADESERLCTLRHYASPSSLHEPVFDGYVDLAARLFSLPIAFISLVDTDEVVYKANHGLPQLARAPRDSAVCALTIRHNKSLVFTDLTQRIQQNCLTTTAVLAVQANEVRFYASAPLRMPDQRPIGTLCVLGHHARPFSAGEQLLLEQLACLVAKTLVVRRVCLANSWLGEGHWSRTQTTLIEGIWDLVALVRYLLTRSSPQASIPATVLEPVARRLTELHSTLATHPASLL